MNTDEKTGIIYRRWQAKEPKGAFILIHGLGAHTGRWSALAQYLAHRCFSSYALELRGFGRTKGSPGYVNSFDTYFFDITRLREIAMKENPGVKVFILGESMGALAAFLMAIKKPGSFDGAVLISPAFTSRLKFRLSEYLDMAVAAIINPTKLFRMPFDSSMCTRDRRYRMMLDTSPAESRLASAKLLFAIAIVQLRSRFAAGRLKVPALFLVAGDDHLVDPKETVKLFKAIRHKDKTLIEYPEMRHALSIDLGKENVFRDIISWAKDRC